VYIKLNTGGKKGGARIKEYVDLENSPNALNKTMYICIFPHDVE
jgi:hypothetical protein